jgi:hypothetical protein
MKKAQAERESLTRDGKATIRGGRGKSTPPEMERDDKTETSR